MNGRSTQFSHGRAAGARMRPIYLMAPPAPLGKPEGHFSWPRSVFAFDLPCHYQYGRFLD
jgi:hypothetical protein